jgi:FtsP/CotA-like multicopper oxidase with cupredoxin domain
MTLSRRDLLRFAAVAAGTWPLLAACDSLGTKEGSTGGLSRSGARLPEPFGVPLPIPPLLQPVRRDATTDYYELTQRAGRAEILPAVDTEIWGYNGVFPGPTIVSTRGRRTVVTHTNELPVPTVVHLHGGRTPAKHNGYPTDLLLPRDGWAGATHVEHGGQVSELTREYIFPLDQPAATLWYHDHRMDFTGPQVYRGLAGFHIVQDDEEQALPLPRGERDIPLMICDRSFAEDGSLRYPSIDASLRGEPGVTDAYLKGALGDVIVVNGVAWPYLDVASARYRFRMLNASNARRYRLALDPPPPTGASFTQIGSDGGLLARPLSHAQLDIAQAERYDVVIDFSAYPVGTRVTLINQSGSGSTSRVMRFHVVRKANDDSAIPPRLPNVEPLARAAASVHRQFVFDQRRGGWAVNGQTFDPQRVDAQPQLGATEIWRLDSDAHHPIHLHLAHFQVLSRGGQAPGPADSGWKDTVDIRTGEQTEIIARFTGYRGRYVVHCHNLEHEDMAMMANFQVV